MEEESVSIVNAPDANKDQIQNNQNENAPPSNSNYKIYYITTPITSNQESKIKDIKDDKKIYIYKKDDKLTYQFKKRQLTLLDTVPDDTEGELENNPHGKDINNPPFFALKKEIKKITNKTKNENNETPAEVLRIGEDEDLSIQEINFSSEEEKKSFIKLMEDKKKEQDLISALEEFRKNEELQDERLKFLKEESDMLLQNILQNNTKEKSEEIRKKWQLITKQFLQIPLELPSPESPSLEPPQEIPSPETYTEITKDNYESYLKHITSAEVESFRKLKINVLSVLLKKESEDLLFTTFIKDYLASDKIKNVKISTSKYFKGKDFLLTAFLNNVCSAILQRPTRISLLLKAIIDSMDESNEYYEKITAMQRYSAAKTEYANSGNNEKEGTIQPLLITLIHNVLRGIDIHLNNYLWAKDNILPLPQDIYKLSDLRENHYKENSLYIDIINNDTLHYKCKTNGAVVENQIKAGTHKSLDEDFMGRLAQAIEGNTPISNDDKNKLLTITCQEGHTPSIRPNPKSLSRKEMRIIEELRKEAVFAYSHNTSSNAKEKLMNKVKSTITIFRNSSSWLLIDFAAFLERSIHDETKSSAQNYINTLISSLTSANNTINDTNVFSKEEKTKKLSKNPASIKELEWMKNNIEILKTSELIMINNIELLTYKALEISDPRKRKESLAIATSEKNKLFEKLYKKYIKISEYSLNLIDSKKTYKEFIEADGLKSVQNKLPVLVKVNNSTSDGYGYYLYSKLNKNVPQLIKNSCKKFPLDRIDFEKKEIVVNGTNYPEIYKNLTSKNYINPAINPIKLVKKDTNVTSNSTLSESTEAVELPNTENANDTLAAQNRKSQEYIASHFNATILKFINDYTPKSNILFSRITWKDDFKIDLEKALDKLTSKDTEITPQKIWNSHVKAIQNILDKYDKLPYTRITGNLRKTLNKCVEFLDAVKPADTLLSAKETLSLKFKFKRDHKRETDKVSGITTTLNTLNNASLVANILRIHDYYNNSLLGITEIVFGSNIKQNKAKINWKKEINALAENAQRLYLECTDDESAQNQLEQNLHKLIENTVCAIRSHTYFGESKSRLANHLAILNNTYINEFSSAKPPNIEVFKDTDTLPQGVIQPMTKELGERYINLHALSRIRGMHHRYKSEVETRIFSTASTKIKTADAISNSLHELKLQNNLEQRPIEFLKKIIGSFTNTLCPNGGTGIQGIYSKGKFGEVYKSIIQYLLDITCYQNQKSNELKYLIKKMKGTFFTTMKSGAAFFKPKTAHSDDNVASQTTNKNSLN